MKKLFAMILAAMMILCSCAFAETTDNSLQAILDKGTLVLGPFQGKPACIRIPLGRGVCGVAAQSRRTQLVANVHAFEGHIACDAESNSEIVIPLIREGRLLGVLDLDSPIFSRFDEADRAGLETLAKRLADGCDWPV